MKAVATDKMAGGLHVLLVGLFVLEGSVQCEIMCWCGKLSGSDADAAGLSVKIGSVSGPKMENSTLLEEQMASKCHRYSLSLFEMEF